MAVPTFIGGGTGATTVSGTTLAPTFPAVVALDQLYYVAISRSAATANTPAGFAPLYADVSGGIGQQVFTKVASGAEAGGLTVTFTGAATVHTARIFSFRGADTIEGSLPNTGSGTAVSPASLTTTGTDRLAIAFVAVASSVTTSAFTGMTGGTWAEIATYPGGNDQIQVQSASLAAAGTLSGGTETIVSSTWISRTLAIFLATSGVGGGAATLPLLGVGS